MSRLLLLVVATAAALLVGAAAQGCDAACLPCVTAAGGRACEALCDSCAPQCAACVHRRPHNVQLCAPLCQEGGQKKPLPPRLSALLPLRGNAAFRSRGSAASMAAALKRERVRQLWLRSSELRRPDMALAARLASAVAAETGMAVSLLLDDIAAPLASTAAAAVCGDGDVAAAAAAAVAADLLPAVPAADGSSSGRSSRSGHPARRRPARVAVPLAALPTEATVLRSGLCGSAVDSSRLRAFQLALLASLKNATAASALHLSTQWPLPSSAALHQLRSLTSVAAIDALLLTVEADVVTLSSTVDKARSLLLPPAAAKKRGNDAGGSRLLVAVDGAAIAHAAASGRTTTAMPLSARLRALAASADGFVVLNGAAMLPHHS
eukprot:PLAT1858.2.p1 GENE.PLAT1858.2~~PLAT1858.2.p1  ORF type:complete len:380 (+),score=140.04 PLAT1858.2:69-1208(+)